GEDVSDGDVVDLAPYTTEVEVEVETVDPDATVQVEGDSDLVAGLNDLVVTVTAVNGDVRSYVVGLNVVLSDDVSAEVTVADQVVSDGDVVELEYGTDSVVVDVVTVDPEATFVVEGDSGLQVGENTLVVTVTAADGETVATYTVILVVAASSDVSLSVFQVNGSDVQDGDSVDLEPGTSEVDVVAEATDPDATVVIEGGTDLQSGENSLVVTVTAADGETTQVYTVILNVALNDDVSLSEFMVSGVAVEDGDVVDLEPGTSEVEVVVEATDLDATVVIEGGTDLQPGENTLTVTVTAADGETTAEYNVTLNVALNNDTTLNTFEVNGQTVADGDSVLLETYTNEVEIVVETTDPEATFTIDGGTDLIVGDNILTVTVIAADGVTLV
ncbi:MAG: hypothetical protein EBZ96_11145, partial [Synechococcaceae bacterium WB9_3_282]|nr:hypothetical protein [Synechococcaceae bacterium WB9_3_282]